MVAAGVLAPASAQSISDRMNNLLFGKPAPDTTNEPTKPEDLPCPNVEVREGAATLAINAPGGDAGPMNTRYQVTIGDTARECAPLGGMMSMRVGVQGRILLGPAGGPGQVDLPLRVVVVQEGPDPKPVVSKLVRLAVQVPPGQTGVPFRHIEQNLTFPLVRPGVLENYVVYVGFDPGAGPVKPERKAKKGPAPKRRK
jgi:hypothetical protein